jgi:Mg2+ and Co2+ transporter CorA
MNFEFMPLIHKPWGFALSAGAMLVIVSVMLWYFRRRRWI